MSDFQWYMPPRVYPSQYPVVFDYDQAYQLFVNHPDMRFAYAINIKTMQIEMVLNLEQADTFFRGGVL